MLLSNDGNTAARQSKNYPNAVSAADLLKDIMTQPLGAAREPVRQVQLCTIGQPRWVWAENLRPGRLRPVIGFAANAKLACPVLTAAANSCWLVCNSFAHAARTKRLTFACRPPFVRSSDRESFGMRRSLGSRDTGATGSESKPSVQEKKNKVFFTPYAPAVLTPRRSNRSQNGSYRDAATIVPQVRPLGFDSN